MTIEGRVERRNPKTALCSRSSQNTARRDQEKAAWAGSRRIANVSGFGSAEILRRAFRRRFYFPPTLWRPKIVTPRIPFLASIGTEDSEYDYSRLHVGT
jgi:AraC-like DNA-binding protein